MHYHLRLFFNLESSITILHILHALPPLLFFSQNQYYIYCMHYPLCWFSLNVNITHITCITCCACFSTWSPALLHYTYYMHYLVCLFLTWGLTITYYTYYMHYPLYWIFTKINITYIICITPSADFFTWIDITYITCINSNFQKKIQNMQYYTYYKYYIPLQPTTCPIYAP